DRLDGIQFLNRFTEQLVDFRRTCSGIIPLHVIPYGQRVDRLSGGGERTAGPPKDRKVETAWGNVLVEEIAGRYGVDVHMHVDLLQHVLNQFGLDSGLGLTSKNHHVDRKGFSILHPLIALNGPTGLVQQLSGFVRIESDYAGVILISLLVLQVDMI